MKDNNEVKANTKSANNVKLDLTNSTYNTSSKSSSINPNSELQCNLAIADKYSDKLRGQVAIMCELAKQNCGIVNFKQANALWIEQFVDTCIYVQDLVAVSTHLISKYNSPKGWKWIPSAELKQLPI